MKKPNGNYINASKYEFIGFMFICVTFPFSFIIKGLVLSRLWLWFAVPLGLPAISHAHAYGLTLLLALFAFTGERDKTIDSLAVDRFKPGVLAFDLFGKMVGVPVVVYMVGYLCHISM